MQILVMKLDGTQQIPGIYIAYLASERGLPTGTMRIGWHRYDVRERIAEHNKQSIEEKLELFAVIERGTFPDEQYLHRHRLLRWRIPGTTETYKKCTAAWAEIFAFCRTERLNIVMLGDPVLSVQSELFKPTDGVHPYLS
jgi:hypothetical protein